MTVPEQTRRAFEIIDEACEQAARVIVEGHGVTFERALAVIKLQPLSYWMIYTGYTRLCLRDSFDKMPLTSLN